MTTNAPEVAAPGEPRFWVLRGATGASTPAKVELRGVTHDYGGVPSIRGVDITIEPGEIVCLLGRSGCGKTTLLRIAAGLERPRTGEVLMNGRVVAGPSAFVPPEKRGIGLMFQDYALFPHMTVLANVMFGLRSLPRRDAETEARRIIGRVGLDRYAAEYPHVLSGGEQQRAALARAVVPRPAVLLMDEPFSGLDRRLRESIREETLGVLRETRVTTILVTHDPEEAMQLADRIALMRDGRIVQLGSAEDLYHRPVDLEAARFFSPLNEAEGVVAHAALTTRFGTFRAPGLAEGTAAVAAIRPQGLLLAPAGEGVPGKVIARHFLGEVDQIELDVDGFEAPMMARLRGNGAPPVGTEIGLRVDPSHVLVFAIAGF